MDESDFVIRIADMNDRINDAQNAAKHAYIRADQANDMSGFTINRIDNITATVTSYQTAIDQLQTRITELEHKIELLTGPCVCEPLI